MLKSLLKITNSSRHALNFSKQGVFYQYPFKFSSTKIEIDRYTELRKLAKVLGTTYFKHNDEVDYTGDVRLIDNNNRLIGIYTVREARKKCQEMNLDLVMINPTITPAICKVFNYKEELYKKFVKEIVNKDISIVQQKGKATKGAKGIKLGPKMTIADLKTKVQLATELAKKNKFLRVNMIVDEASEEAGKNIIYTYKDLAKDFLRPMGELEERLVEEEDAEELLEDEDGETYNKKLLILEFESLKFTDTASGVLTEEDIRRLVQNFIMKEAKEEQDRMSNQREQTDADYAAAMREIRNEKAEAKKSKSTIEEEQDTELLSRLILSAKNYEQSPADIEREIEEIKMRHGNTRDTAFLEYLIEEQQKKLNDFKKVILLANNVMNKKRKY